MDSVVPAELLDVQVTQPGPKTCIITVTGELDALTAPVFTETLAAAQAG